MHDRLIS